MTDKALGKIVIARTGLGHFQGIGKVIAFCDAPTYTIERPDGSRFNWRADLCKGPIADCPVCHGKGFALLDDYTEHLDILPVAMCPRCTE